MTMNVRRRGKLSEYQNGHYFLYVTEWDAQEDGAGRQHVEIEIYYAKARSVWSTTDPWKLEEAKRIFSENPSWFESARLDAGEVPTLLDWFDAYKCCVCGKRSPIDDTDALINYGWHIEGGKHVEGPPEKRMEWCPECWEKVKRKETT